MTRASLEPERPWPPTAFRRFAKAIKTSTSPARIVTDAGPAYIKALGNPQGPHVLACDLVGTRLARWFGLQTFDDAILLLGETDEVLLHDGRRTLPGPAFATREERGMPWSGDEEDLALLDNPEDLSRLVVFDTWLRNCDRHPPDLTARRPNYDNVFFSAERASGRRFRLVAMDHGHCFTCGKELTAHTATIEAVRDERAYGRFPAFVSRLRADVVQDGLARLGALPQAVVEQSVAAIPAAWDVASEARLALKMLITDRAAFLAGEAAAVQNRLLDP